MSAIANKVELPRRVVKISGNREILYGGKFYLRDGKIKESGTLIKESIEEALKELEAHEAQFDILPIRGYY